MGGAIASDFEDKVGSISVGKRTDLVVLDRDRLAIPPERISVARVDLTVLVGRVVFRR